MNNRVGLLEGEVHRLSQGDILRMAVGLRPKGLSERLCARLQQAQMQMVYSSYRSINHFTLVAMPILILIFCDLTQIFDAAWILLVAVQLVICSYLALWMGRRLRSGKLQPHQMIRALLPAAFISGWISGGIPGLVLEPNSIGATGLNAQQTLAMISCLLWVLVGVMWTPTFLPNMLALIAGALCSLVFSFYHQKSADGLVSSLWMLNATILLLPGYVMATSAWLRDRLEKLVLEEQHSTLAHSFADFQDGARDWAWQTDASLHVTETPPERIEFLPRACRPVSLDGMFDPDCPDYPALERAVLRREEIPMLRLRRLHINPHADPIWWQIRGQPKVSADGRFDGYLLIASDISTEFELKRTREALHMTEQKLGEMTEGRHAPARLLSDLVEALDKQGKGANQSGVLREAISKARDAVSASHALTSTRPAISEPPPACPPKRAETRILLCDEDKVRRRVMTRHLTRAGLAAMECATLEEAQSALEAGLKAAVALLFADPESGKTQGAIEPFLALAQKRRMMVFCRAISAPAALQSAIALDPEADLTDVVAEIERNLSRRNQAA